MMNMNLRGLTKLGILACTISALSASTNVFADADIAVQPTGTALEATTNVDLCVVVPRVLIFGVGAVADDVAKLRWTIDNAAGVAVGNNQSYSGAPGTFAPPAPLGATAIAEVVSGGPDVNTADNIAELPVFLFSNSGADVVITTTVSGGTAGSGTVDALDHDTLPATTIPITLFTAGDGGVITQPTLANNQVATTAHAAGIVNLADVWTYEYNPAATPPAGGTYEARVTYVAATP